MVPGDHRSPLRCQSSDQAILIRQTRIPPRLDRVGGGLPPLRLHGPDGNGTTSWKHPWSALTSRALTPVSMPACLKIKQEDFLHLTDDSYQSNYRITSFASNE
jgi:hypothetical protein